MTGRKKKKKAKRTKRVSNVINQVKEPLQLLETLKDEGFARVLYMLGMASGLTKNLNKDGINQQVKEIVQLLGLATKDELRQLKRQIRALESRIEDLEAQFVEETETDGLEDDE